MDQDQDLTNVQSAIHPTNILDHVLAILYSQPPSHVISCGRQRQPQVVLQIPGGGASHVSQALGVVPQMSLILDHSCLSAQGGMQAEIIRGGIEGPSLQHLL
jgi:hypothetical protein